MTRVRNFLWLLLLIGSVSIDFAARLILDFDTQRIVTFEAAFFGALFLLLTVIVKRWRAANAKVRRIEISLAVIFGLGAIRSTLWAVGLTVATANLIVLVIGMAAIIGVIVWRRISQGRSPVA